MSTSKHDKLDVLKRLYGNDEVVAMNEEIRRRPEVGEEVMVGDLPGRFRVIDREGGVYILESEHGTRCRAGVWCVRLAEDPKAA